MLQAGRRISAGVAASSRTSSRPQATKPKNQIVSVTTSRSYSSGRYVFGIDFGSALSRVAVVDPERGQPVVLTNPEDGALYWHNAVAVDKATGEVLVGRGAKEMSLDNPEKVALNVRGMLGAHSKPPKSSKPSPKVKMVGSVATLQLEGKTYTPQELASFIFKSMKNACESYIASKQPAGAQPSTEEVKIEACISVPQEFTVAQRNAVTAAAELAGISVVNLIEEPIAALYSTRRIENDGWYSINDYGETFKSHLVRVKNGKADVIQGATRRYDWLRETLDDAFGQYIVKRVNKRFNKAQFAAKMVEETNYALMDFYEYEPRDKHVREAIPYISREARTLSAATAGRLATERLRKEVFDSLQYINPINVTNQVLIGGASMAYPDISNVLERVWGTRLGDIVAPADQAIAVGAAIRAAEDAGVAKTGFRGREITSEGKFKTVACAVNAHVTEYTNPVAWSAAVTETPLAPTFSFENLAAATPVIPLYPEYNPLYRKPAVAISYAMKKDPFSGKDERWARIAVRAPTPDPSELPEQRPIVKLLFVMNTTCPPYFDTAAKVADEITKWEELVKQDDQLHFSLIKTPGDSERSFQQREKEKQYKLDILRNLRDHQTAFYRTKNRGIEAVSAIMRELGGQDAVGCIALGKDRAPIIVPLTKMDQQDYDLVPRTLRLGDDTGRGAEQYAEVIQRAHAAMVDLMRADEAAMAEEEARAAEEAARQAEAKSASAPAGEDEEKKPTPESKEPEKASEQKKKIPRKTEYRIVVIGDAPPAATGMAELESALNSAAQDNITTTFLNIDGPNFDGRFHQMVSRVRGVRTLRWWRRNTGAHDFQTEWHGTGKIFKYLVEPHYRALTVKVEFDKYNIVRIYGGPSTSKERLRYERGTNVFNFKLGSVDGDYAHHIADDALSWDPTVDSNSVLVKLEPRTSDKEPMHDKLVRLSAAASPSAPNADDTSLSMYPSLAYNTQSRAGVTLKYIDVDGSKREHNQNIWLADDCMPGYHDEAGVQSLVAIAKISDFMRAILHNPVQTALADSGESIVNIPLPSVETGIAPINTKLEDSLLANYDPENSEFSAIMNSLFALKQRGHFAFAKEYLAMLEKMTKFYFTERWDHLCGKRYADFEYNISRDFLARMLMSIRQGVLGQEKYPDKTLNRWLSKASKIPGFMPLYKLSRGTIPIFRKFNRIYKEQLKARKALLAGPSTVPAAFGNLRVHPYETNDDPHNMDKNVENLIYKLETLEKRDQSEIPVEDPQYLRLVAVDHGDEITATQRKIDHMNKFLHDAIEEQFHVGRTKLAAMVKDKDLAERIKIRTLKNSSFTNRYVTRDSPFADKYNRSEDTREIKVELHMGEALEMIRDPDERAQFMEKMRETENEDRTILRELKGLKPLAPLSAEEFSAPTIDEALEWRLKTWYPTGSNLPRKNIEMQRRTMAGFMQAAKKGLNPYDSVNSDKDIDKEEQAIESKLRRAKQRKIAEKLTREAVAKSKEEAAKLAELQAGETAVDGSEASTKKKKAKKPVRRLTRKEAKLVNTLFWKSKSKKRKSKKSKKKSKEEELDMSAPEHVTAEEAAEEDRKAEEEERAAAAAQQRAASEIVSLSRKVAHAELQRLATNKHARAEVVYMDQNAWKPLPKAYFPGMADKSVFDDLKDSLYAITLSATEMDLREAQVFDYYFRKRVEWGLPEDLRQNPKGQPNPHLRGRDKKVHNPRFRGAPVWNLDPWLISTEELERRTQHCLRHPYAGLFYEPGDADYQKEKREYYINKVSWEVRRRLAKARNATFNEPEPQSPDMTRDPINRFTSSLELSLLPEGPLAEVKKCVFEREVRAGHTIFNYGVEEILNKKQAEADVATRTLVRRKVVPLMPGLIKEKIKALESEKATIASTNYVAPTFDPAQRYGIIDHRTPEQLAADCAVRVSAIEGEVSVLSSKIALYQTEAELYAKGMTYNQVEKQLTLLQQKDLPSADEHVSTTAVAPKQKKKVKGLSIPSRAVLMRWKRMSSKKTWEQAKKNLHTLVMYKLKKRLEFLKKKKEKRKASAAATAKPADNEDPSTTN